MWSVFATNLPKSDQVVILGRLWPLVLRKTLGKGPFQMADGVRWFGGLQLGQEELTLLLER